MRQFSGRSAKKTPNVIVLLALATMTLPSLAAQQSKTLPDGLYARITTAKGAITLLLEYEKAPLTVTNFVGLAEGSLDAAAGKHFYDGLVFHRVVADFVIQGGDPLGNGRGGPGYKFPNEIAPELHHDGPGTLAMANAGPDTNGSQFYITMGAYPQLDGKYNVFGHVVDGMDVVRKIAVGDKMDRVEILRIGAAALAFKVDQASFDKRVKDLALAAIKKQWPDLVLGSDSVFQKTLQAGAGPLPTVGATLSVNYKGMFPSGKVFDQSNPQNGPFQFQVGKGQVIPGWDKVLLTMKKGEKRLVVFPPELGYGAAGAGGVIPPNAFLAFEIELVEIK